MKAGSAHHVRVEAVDQDHAAGGRGGRGQEDGVITAGAHSAHGAEREPAQAVGLQPFGRLVEGAGQWEVSSLNTTPPFITKRTFSSALVSRRGSPSTAITSAKAP